MAFNRVTKRRFAWNLSSIQPQGRRDCFQTPYNQREIGIFPQKMPKNGRKRSQKGSTKAQCTSAELNASAKQAQGNTSSEN